MAAWDITTAGSRYMFSETRGDYISCAKIDDNHFITVYAGNNTLGYAQVIAVNTSTWAPTAAGSVLNFYNATFYGGFLLTIGGNRAILLYRGASNHSYAQVFAINTSTWAVTTTGTPLDYDTQYGGVQSAYWIDSNHFIATYSGEGADGYAQTFAINTSTWAVTTAAERLEFDTTVASSNSVIAIDSTHFVNVWTGPDSDGFAQVFAINTSTWAITTAGSSLEFDTVNGGYVRAIAIDSTHFINVWAGPDSDGFAQVFAINTSTWAITTAAANIEFDTQRLYWNDSVLVDSNHLINFWTGPGTYNSGYTQVFTVELPATAVSADKVITMISPGVYKGTITSNVYTNDELIDLGGDVCVETKNGKVVMKT